MPLLACRGRLHVMQAYLLCALLFLQDAMGRRSPWKLLQYTAQLQWGLQPGALAVVKARSLQRASCVRALLGMSAAVAPFPLGAVNDFAYKEA